MLSPLRLALPLLLAGAVGIPTLDAQKRHHVDASVSSSGNGTSWSTAFKTLQEALKVCQAFDDIWVARGNYAGGFTVPGFVNLYGGFEPGDTRLTQRRPIQNPSFLDGKNKERVLTVGDKALIDGFVVQNGRSTIPGGAGLLILSTSPTVRNCTFINNTLATGRGAAVCIGRPTVALTAPVLENCVFWNNGKGGSAHCIDIEGFVRPIFRNLTIVGNENDGLTFRLGAISYMYNCAFVNNSGVGANHLDTRSGGALEDCLFHGNTKGAYKYTTTTYQTAKAVNTAFSYAKRNIDGDPKFVNEKGGDFRPSDGSPLIDVGQDFAQAGILDPYGVSRRLDGDRNGFVKTDIGAFEFTNVLLDYTGTPSANQTVSVVTTGYKNSPVMMVVGIKPANTPVYLANMGYVLVDTASLALFLPWPAIGSNPVKFTVPSGAQGASLMLQAATGTGWGNTSNAIDIRIR